MKRAIIVACAAVLFVACQGNNDSTAGGTPQGTAKGEQGEISQFSYPGKPQQKPVPVNVAQGNQDFSAKMVGARPGEIREFANSDGTKAYVLRTDGKTSAKQFADYVFNKQEKMDIDATQLRSVAMSLTAQNGLNSGPDAGLPEGSLVVCQTGLFSHLKTADSQPTKDSSPSLQPGTKKALGYSPASGSTSGGLDID